MKITRLSLAVWMSIAVAGCANQATKPDAKASQAAAAAQTAASLQEQGLRILDAAIQARGGLDKIKVMASKTYQSKGSYQGMPYVANNVFQIGTLLMEVGAEGGSSARMTMVWGLDKCWNKSGKVLLPCGEEEKKNGQASMTIDKASLLFPLKQPGWELSGSKAEQDGKAYEVLMVRETASGVTGVLMFDPTTHLLARVKYQGTRGGLTGEFVMDVQEHKELCGVPFPSKMATTFSAQPYVSEEVVEMKCGPVDASLFNQPAQVADKTVEEHPTGPAVLVCTSMKGPYSGMEAAMKKLGEFMVLNNLAAMDAPLAIYQKAPPAVKAPEKFVTDVCYPISGEPALTLEKGGEFSVQKLDPGAVLAMYGVGEYGKKCEELASLLSKEAAKKRLKVAGPLRQIFYMDPKSAPPDQLVSQLQLPLKVTPKPVDKGKKK